MTQITRRSALTLGAAAATSLVVAGCTSPNAPTTAGSASGGSRGTGAPLTLLLLGPTQELIDHVKNVVVPDVTKATGSTVEVQSSDWGSAFQKVTTGAASNSLADVLMIGGIWTAPLAAKNVLLDLSERVAAWDQTPQFYPGMLADGVYQGTSYAVPISSDVRPGIYRKDILDAAGVTTLPTTWDEFRAAAQKVKDAGLAKVPISWGQDKSIGLQQAFAILFLQAGGRYWDAQGKPSFSSDAGRKALSFLVGTYADGLADANQVYSGSGPMPLPSGESALTTATSGMATYRNAQANAAENVSKLVVGPALKADAGSAPVAVAWVNKVAVARTTRNPAGAWALVQALTGKEHGAEITRLLDGLPVRKDFADLPWINDYAKAVVAAADTAISQPPNPVMMQLGPAVKTLLEPAIRGQVSVDDTLRAIDEKVASLDA